MPTFEELTLEEQLSMPASYQAELKNRPQERRGEGARAAGGGECTKYFKRMRADGKIEWKILTGQRCGPTPPPQPEPTPRAAPPPPACSSAGPWIGRIAYWDVNQSGNSGFVARWSADSRAAVGGLAPVCAAEVGALNDEIDRITRNFGGSRAAVPAQVRVPVEFLAIAARNARKT